MRVVQGVAEARMRKYAAVILLLLSLLGTAIASDMVVITAKGKKYHRSNCRTVKQYVKELTVEEAQKLGYKPCKVCKP